MIAQRSPYEDEGRQKQRVAFHYPLRRIRARVHFTLQHRQRDVDSRCIDAGHRRAQASGGKNPRAQRRAPLGRADCRSRSVVARQPEHAACFAATLSSIPPPCEWVLGNMSSQNERAVLAGGCFWGVQELLRTYPGVISTRVGYTGGEVANATYRNHGTHAEAVEILFDPSRISYRQLLEFFFQIHDPSTLNRQGNDRGPSYRSAIFYTTDEQRRIAEETIADVNASGIWPGKVVTEIAPAGPFWEAEPEHQDYLQKYPDGYTCHFVRPNWRLPQRARA